MDGPDLSHLLDVDDSLSPSEEVLEGIVRRHRRIRVRRARSAATIALVIVVAGAGVGIGLSRRGTTASAIPPNTSAPVSARVSSPTLPASGGSAPKGLGWIAVGSGTSEFSAAASTSRVEAGTSGKGLSAAGRLAGDRRLQRHRVTGMRHSRLRGQPALR